MTNGIQPSSPLNKITVPAKRKGKQELLQLIERLSLVVQEVQSEHPDRAGALVGPIVGLQSHLSTS